MHYTASRSRKLVALASLLLLLFIFAGPYAAVAYQINGTAGNATNAFVLDNTYAQVLGGINLALFIIFFVFCSITLVASLVGGVLGSGYTQKIFGIAFASAIMYFYSVAILIIKNYKLHDLLVLPYARFGLLEFIVANFGDVYPIPDGTAYTTVKDWFTANEMFVPKIIILLVVLFWWNTTPYLTAYAQYLEMKHSDSPRFTKGFRAFMHLAKRVIFAISHPICTMPVVSCILAMIVNPNLLSYGTVGWAVVLTLAAALCFLYLLFVKTLRLATLLYINEHICSEEVRFTGIAGSIGYAIKPEELEQTPEGDQVVIPAADAPNYGPSAGLATALRIVRDYIVCSPHRLFQLFMDRVMLPIFVQWAARTGRLPREALMEKSISHKMLFMFFLKSMPFVYYETGSEYREVYAVIRLSYSLRNVPYEYDVVLLRVFCWLGILALFGWNSIVYLAVLLPFQLYFVVFYAVHLPHYSWIKALQTLLFEFLVLVQIVLMLILVANTAQTWTLAVSVALNILVVACSLLSLVAAVISATVFCCKVYRPGRKQYQESIANEQPESKYDETFITIDLGAPKRTQESDVKEVDEEEYQIQEENAEMEQPHEEQSVVTVEYPGVPETISGYKDLHVVENVQLEAAVTHEELEVPYDAHEPIHEEEASTNQALLSPVTEEEHHEEIDVIESQYYE